MRQFAFFLSFYPGYTMQDVMKEYAIRFFSLLDKAYELDAERQMKDATAVTAGMADQKSRQQYMDGLKRTAEGTLPGDGSDDYSALDVLKQRL